MLAVAALLSFTFAPEPAQAEWTQDFWCDEEAGGHTLSAGIVYWGQDVHPFYPDTNCYIHSNAAHEGIGGE